MGRWRKHFPFGWWVWGLFFVFFFNFHAGSSRHRRTETELHEGSQGPGQPRLPIPTAAWALLLPPRMHPILPQTQGPQPPPCGLALWPAATAPGPTSHTGKPRLPASPGGRSQVRPPPHHSRAGGQPLFFPKNIEKRSSQEPVAEHKGTFQDDRNSHLVLSNTVGVALWGSSSRPGNAAHGTANPNLSFNFILIH